MFRKMKSDYVSWLLLIGIVVLLLEVAFFNHGLIFSLLISSAMIYFGRKRLHRTSGKIIFWGGLIFLIVSVFNMMTFKFLLLAVLIYFLIQLAQSKRKPGRIQPVVKEPLHTDQQETVIKRGPLFTNLLFGQQKTPDHIYEWHDVNIQTGVGDTDIDLSNTVLPEGETVILIRKFIGNVRIMVPYELEVSVNHSVIAGSTAVFGVQEPKMFNQVVHLQTQGYEKADQKIKIFTSFLIGDLEVKRI